MLVALVVLSVIILGVVTGRSSSTKLSSFLEIEKRKSQNDKKKSNSGTNFPTPAPTTVMPTVVPTNFLSCPWVKPNDVKNTVQAGQIGSQLSRNQCRKGDNLAIVSGSVTLGDCKNYCQLQTFMSSTLSATNECILNFNLFTGTLPLVDKTFCDGLNNPTSARKTCNSLQFTPSSEGSAKGECRLKYARSGALETCKNVLTETYDFNCSEDK